MLNFVYTLALGFNMALGKYARCKGMLTMVPKRCFNFQFPYVYKFSLDLKKRT